MLKKIRTRFAPSPTGYLHVGGLRTALYAYLLAKQHQGTFLLRIEDTDRERYVSDGINNILTSLAWAGINPDEGVRLENNTIVNSGPAGSYIQSERLSIYKKYAEKLIEQGHAYYCFCTPERLARVREERQANKLPPGYDGLCATLSESEVKEKLSHNTHSVIRLKMPEHGETKWNDLIRGEVIFKNDDVDDQVLIKSDGYPTYHLAVVVDDHEMNISHVIRGEEWISSTPKHLMLYHYFGWEPPHFAHLPLLLNSDKSKLSKRQGDVAVLDYKAKGYLPDALLNFVAFLGWNPGNENEIFSLEQLITSFSLDKVGKSGAVFNIEKLDWYNREYLKKLHPEELVDYILAYLPNELQTKEHDREFLLRLAPLLLERIHKGADLAQMFEQGELTYYFQEPTYPKELLLWKNTKATREGYMETAERLQHVIKLINEAPASNDSEAVKAIIFPYAEKEGRGEILWPLRVALSGKEKSPDPFTLTSLFGKHETIKRIEFAVALLSS
jgi:glutamyl-tRNA synthetase